MDWITIRAEFRKQGEGVVHEYTGGCPSWRLDQQRVCWEGRYAEGLDAGCYYTRMEYEAESHDPVTGVVTRYRNSANSNDMCVITPPPPPG